MKAFYIITFLSLCFLMQTACSISESEGRECLRDAGRCQDPAALAVTAIKTKGVGHCQYTEEEIIFWQQTRAPIPESHNDTALSSVWLGNLEGYTTMLNINSNDLQGFCLFEINDPENFDLAALKARLDQSLEQIKN